MKPFMNEEFLLSNEVASRLFHDHAENCPIIDYHNHLSAREIYEKRTYSNLTQIWLECDHYKWRCMRVCGVAEKYVTGDASEYEKFEAFATIMPRLIGSPVYHWAHLELQRYFGIHELLNQNTCKAIWDKTCQMLQDGSINAVTLLEQRKVKVLCTTDDPADSLEWHLKLQGAGLSFLTLPSFRPDRFINIDQAPWTTALEQLGQRYGAITGWDSLCAALSKSLDFFQTAGCKVTDHGFTHFNYASCGDPAPIVAKALAGERLTGEEIAVYQGALLRFLAGEYEKRGMAMQLHLGPIRNNSPRIVSAFGADGGGDSIGDATDPFLLGAFLGDLEGSDRLPRTILYNLHPADTAMLATMAVNFASDGAKVQYGAAWWLHDHIRGISEQLDQLLETGMISGSVGMLTDSRSFTSFTRHEYFRRILCDKLGALVERGEYPCDMETLGSMVEDICWRNAVNYFGFDI